MCSWSSSSPRLVATENCQLSTSASWAQEAAGGAEKNSWFCGERAGLEGEGLGRPVTRLGPCRAPLLEQHGGGAYGPQGRGCQGAPTPEPNRA